MKKIIALLLVAVMLGTVFACTDNDGKNETTTENGGEVTDDGRYHADVPAKKYDGADFTIMCRSRDSSNGEFAIFAEEESTVPMEAAAFVRNAKIQDDFDLKIKVEEILTERKNGVFYRMLNEDISSQDYICDICVPGIIDAATLSVMNLFYDLRNVPYIDLEQPWWQKSLNDSISLVGHQFFAINDMLFNDKNDSYVMFFNKDLFDDNSMEYPYKSVYDNKWTFDTFYSMIKNYGKDLDMDGKDFDDAYGIVYNLSDTFFVGAGIMGATVDQKTGLPKQLEASERLTDMFGKMRSMIYDNEYCAFDISKENAIVDGSALGTYKTIFLGGNVLFMNYALYAYAMFLNNAQFDVGCVPVPKYDEAQEEYYVRAGYNGSTSVAILTTVPDRYVERAGIIMEAMSAESKNIVTPVYYDKLLTNRYAQDEDSKYMIDLCIKSEVFDLDQIFVWGNMLTALQKELHKGSISPQAYMDATKDMIRRKINTTVELYEDIGLGEE